MTTTPQTPPWEQWHGDATPKRPAMLVDLRRCIGCHACSVACKTEHDVPLGAFRMRVRWLPRPDRPTLAFIPLFAADTCDFGANRARAGLAPACVSACPTGALTFGDIDDGSSAVSQRIESLDAKPFGGPAATHDDVYYAGHEPWMATAVGRGVPLSPDDPDIIYEQGKGGPA